MITDENSVRIVLLENQQTKPETDYISLCNSTRNPKDLAYLSESVVLSNRNSSRSADCLLYIIQILKNNYPTLIGITIYYVFLFARAWL